LHAFKNGSLIVTDDEIDLPEVFTKLRQAIQKNQLDFKLSKKTKFLVFKKADLKKMIEFKHVNSDHAMTDKTIGSLLSRLWKNVSALRDIEFVRIFAGIPSNTPWLEVLETSTPLAVLTYY
jgi:hypothetical protein